jgi:hypothetical protein
MLMTHFICQTVLKPSSVTNGKNNGAITPSLTPTMQVGQDSDAGGGGWFTGNVYVACSDCVVVLALGDLVTWRHFVRGLEAAAQRFIIKLSM